MDIDLINIALSAFKSFMEGFAYEFGRETAKKIHILFENKLIPTYGSKENFIKILFENSEKGAIEFALNYINSLLENPDYLFDEKISENLLTEMQRYIEQYLRNQNLNINLYTLEKVKFWLAYSRQNTTILEFLKNKGLPVYPLILKIEDLEEYKNFINEKEFILETFYDYFNFKQKLESFIFESEKPILIITGERFSGKSFLLKYAYYYLVDLQKKYSNLINKIYSPVSLDESKKYYSIKSFKDIFKLHDNNTKDLGKINFNKLEGSNFILIDYAKFEKKVWEFLDTLYRRRKNVDIKFIMTVPNKEVNKIPQYVRHYRCKLINIPTPKVRDGLEIIKRQLEFFMQKFNIKDRFAEEESFLTKRIIEILEKYYDKKDVVYPLYDFFEKADKAVRYYIARLYLKEQINKISK